MPNQFGHVTLEQYNNLLNELAPTPPAPSPPQTPPPISTSNVSSMDWSHPWDRPKVPTSSEKIYNRPLIEAFARLLAGKVAEGEIGLEIECEGMDLFSTPIKWWSCHQDQSLRAHGEHPPIEYVLRKPVSREEVPDCLDYLSKKLKLTGSTIDDSHRTSVHVHVNCQDLTLKQVYQYVCLYLIFEELLVEFSGPERVGNLFCLRAKDAEYFITVLENAITSEDFRELFSNDLRYAACNTAALGRFGSLEFRSMRGTVDQELIQTWVDILLLLKDKALTYDDPRAIVEDFHNSRPAAFFDKIFASKPNLYKLFAHNPNLSRSMWDGLRLMRDVACAIKWEKRGVVKKKESPEKDPFEPVRYQLNWGVWVEPTDSGRFWVYNYTDDMLNGQFLGRYCNIPARTRCLAGSDGRLVGISEDI